MKHLLYVLLLGIPLQASNKKQPAGHPTRAQFTITNQHAGGTSTSKTYKTHLLKNGLSGVVLLAVARGALRIVNNNPVFTIPEYRKDIGHWFGNSMQPITMRLAIAGCAAFGLNRLWNIYEVRHRSLTTRRGTDSLRTKQSQAQEAS